jgi:hypothetical protein
VVFSIRKVLKTVNSAVLNMVLSVLNKSLTAGLRCEHVSGLSNI